MPSIAALCSAAKLERTTFNNLRASGRIEAWGDEQSEGFAIRIGLFAALKATGFLTPAAVDLADELASRKRLPNWYVRNALDNEARFFSADEFAKISLENLLGLVDGGEGEIVEEDKPPSVSLVSLPAAICIINLHAVRDRMLNCFSKAR